MASTIDQAITDAETVRADRASGAKEHVEIDEHEAKLERIRATIAARDAEIAALRKIVAAVATLEPYNAYLNDLERCFFCGVERNMWKTGEFSHKPLCLVIRARALLGSQTPDESGQE